MYGVEPPRRGQPIDPTAFWALRFRLSHLGTGEDESESPHLDGSARAKPFSDDAGLWRLDAIDSDRLKEMRAKVEAEQLPELNWVRLL
jgi:hypothetical protein